MSKHSRQDSLNDLQQPAQQGGFVSAYSPTEPDGTPAKESVFAGELNSHSRFNRDYTDLRGKKKRKRHIAMVVILIALLVVGAAAAYAAMLYIQGVNDALGFDDDKEAVDVKEALSPAVSNEPFYMMIIGSDTRNDDADQRSDTAIVARIDMQAKQVTLISIPRDTAINLEGYGTQKFNAAYSYYGASGAIKAAETLLGVQISHYTEIDFDGLVDLVDALDGVTVDVPERINDKKAGNQVIEAGEQTLNGEQALIFARSRAYTMGDFTRTENQRLLVAAILQKLIQEGTAERLAAVQAGAQCLTTDMNVSEILEYFNALQGDTSNMTIYSAMVPSATAEKDGVSYVVCDIETLARMMEVVEEGGDPATVYSAYSTPETEGLAGSVTDVASGVTAAAGSASSSPTGASSSQFR